MGIDHDILAKAYNSLSESEELHIDRLSARRVRTAVYKYLGKSTVINNKRLCQRSLVYLDQRCCPDSDKMALVWSINSLANGWIVPVYINWSDLKLIKETEI